VNWCKIALKILIFFLANENFTKKLPNFSHLIKSVASIAPIFNVKGPLHASFLANISVVLKVFSNLCHHQH
jgi:hypothetical protein